MTEENQDNQSQEGVKKENISPEDCKRKCEEYLNNWKRERADFLNYKKDELERAMVLIGHSKEKFVLKLLPILDAIYLAQSHMPESIKNDSWAEGFLQIKKQFEEFLKKEGVEQIEVLGKPFDPNFMEIVDQVEAEKSGGDPARNASHSDAGGPLSAESGMVVEETQKGYKIGEKVLRPAKVKISK